MGYRALDQWTREIPILPKRGQITDRNGVILADNATAYTVFARSNAVKDKAHPATLLAKLLEVSEESLYERLTKKKASEVTIARRVIKQSIIRLAESNLEGIYYARDNLRFYPKGDALCQVLGFSSVDNVGTTGIERYYDEYLAGKKGELLYETDLVGIEIEGSVATYLPAEDGYHVELTIDYGIQEIVESSLERVLHTYHPTGAQCIVLDVNTFEVLALANTPSYDLNEVPRNEGELLNALSRNRFVSDIYEPGSTFKIITSAINVEEHLQGNPKAFSTKYVFPSARTRSVDGTTVKCWSNHANGKHCNQTLADALNSSCNPCFTDIALSIGKETFYDYLTAFGFGKQTGVDFGGEAFGLLLPQKAVRECDLARIGLGQTVAVTGLQLACATAAAVNGGNYYTPHIVKKIYSSDGYTEKEVKPTVMRKVISENASKIVASMLEGVVSEGSGKKAFVEGARVGGKTGTAQKYENGRIAAGKYVSSFVGFFPADAPEYVVLVIIDEPQGQYYGSVVAAPCAGEIIRGIIALDEGKSI